MNTKTRKITISAILAAITLLLGLTPIGYIPIPPIVMTLLCIPVIIGTILEGLSVGLTLGFVFGLTSLLKAVGISIVPDPFGTWLFNNFPLQAIVTIFIPRLLIPVVVWLISKAFSLNSKGIKNKVGIGLSALAGSLTNTVFFLGFMYILMLPNAGALAATFKTTTEGLLTTIVTIGAVNGLPEAAAAVVLSIPIVFAVSKVRVRK